VGRALGITLAGVEDGEDFDLRRDLIDQTLIRMDLLKDRQPPRDRAEQQVTLQRDPYVPARFQEGAPGWQGRVNDALRKFAKRSPTDQLSDQLNS
jgi:uncharacterized protein (DUF4415 family)